MQTEPIHNKEEAMDIETIRKDFPQLQQVVNGHPLVYLDNAATTLKPQIVIEAIGRHLSYEASNVHRGVHTFSEISSEKYENVRKTVKDFIEAKKESEIIFTKGTTESINLVASSFGQKFLDEKSEVLITQMEHHSNIVPWQIACERSGAKLRFIPVLENGELDLKNLDNLISHKTKIVALTHVSNTLGTINPIEKIISLAHSKGAKVLIDGAQAIAHMSVNVQALDVDFYVFSGHKIYGPTGVGVLYGKEELLNELPPYQSGGSMIHTVTMEKSTYAPLPEKFEAGTPPIAEVIGLGCAIDYVKNIGFSFIKKHEHELLAYANDKLKDIKGIRLIGQANNKISVISFVLDNVHPHDIGTLCDQHGVALRTGHHCTQPLMTFYKVPATARASFSIYNTKKEVDILVETLKKIVEFF